jgi:hypothetical protein
MILNGRRIMSREYLKRDMISSAQGVEARYYA